MAAEFKLICDVRSSETLSVGPTLADDQVCFCYENEPGETKGSVFVSKQEARALAKYLLSISK